MIDILNHMAASYCDEINQVWLTCMKKFDGVNIDPVVFDPFSEKLREGLESGFQFNIQFDTRAYIQERVNAGGTDPDLLAYPGWKELTWIRRMEESSNDPQGFWLQMQLEQLGNEYTRRILQSYAADHAQRKGPFYKTDDITSIHVYVYMGNPLHELILITQIDQENSSYVKNSC